MIDTTETRQYGYFWMTESSEEYEMGYLDHFNPMVRPHFTDDKGKAWHNFRPIDQGPPAHLAHLFTD